MALAPSSFQEFLSSDEAFSAITRYTYEQKGAVPISYVNQTTQRICKRFSGPRWNDGRKQKVQNHVE